MAGIVQRGGPPGAMAEADEAQHNGEGEVVVS